MKIKEKNFFLNLFFYFQFKKKGVKNSFDLLQNILKFIFILYKKNCTKKKSGEGGVSKPASSEFNFSQTALFSKHFQPFCVESKKNEPKI